MKKVIAVLLAMTFLLLPTVVLVSCGAAEYKVDFMVDGEVYDTITVNGEDTIVFPERPTKENYVFGGWYFDEGTWKEKVTSVALQEITSDIEVYAKFTRSQDGDSSGEEGGGQTNEGGTGGNPDQGADGIHLNTTGNGGTTPSQGNNGVDAKTETITGFMVGNSLTISISVERLQALMATQNYTLQVDQQMSAGAILAQHVGMQNTETGEYFPCNNFNKPVSNSYTYFDAMAAKAYDFASLQLYVNYVNTPNQYKSDLTTPVTVDGKDGTYYNHCRQGDFETITLMIDYALEQRAENGTGTNNFIIYQTWNDLLNLEWYIDTDRDGIWEFSEYYNNAPYNTTATQPNLIAANKAATELLMSQLREYYKDTDVNIVLSNAGEMLSVMDDKIKDGKMTGFATYMNRNSKYYLDARNGGTDLNMDGDYDDAGETSNPVSGMGAPLLKSAYVQDYGVLNLYADRIHMSAYPHAGPDDGTLACYMTAVAMYTAITGNSPVGLPVDTGSKTLRGNYTARIDPEEDAALVKLVQEIVFGVMVDNNESITEDAPVRPSSQLAIKSTFEESGTATSKGKLTMTDDISGGTLTWREIETNSSINYSAMPLFCESLGCIKINGRGTTRYLALDLTSYMTVGHEYDFSVDMQAELFFTEYLRGQLWIKLTKNDGTYELIKIAEEYITGGVTQTGALKAVKGTYRHADETVTKVEILTNVQTLEGNNVTKYFFDNFRMWEFDEFTDVDITPVPAPLAE